MPIDSDFEQPQATISTSMTAIPTTEQQESHETTAATIVSSTGVSVALIATVIGGVASSLLVFMLALVLLLLLALVWITRKHKRVAANKAQYNLDHYQEPQLEGREEQHRDNEACDMGMKSNDAYVSATHQILTTYNVAYGQATPQMPTVDNVAYGQIYRE